MSKTFVRHTTPYDLGNCDQRLQASIDGKVFSVFWDAVKEVPIVETIGGVYYEGVGEDFTYEDIFDEFFGICEWQVEDCEFSLTLNTFEVDQMVKDDEAFSIELTVY